METFWYIAVTLMLALYMVLDGFDFGVGILYPFLGRSEADRHAMHDAIGPVWNGNEVWLIGAGGLLFFAFPKAYAAGFSGFYLALILVLWLLMLRGLTLELRSHVDHPLWRQLCDVIFSGASLLLAFVFGAALGNVIRGVPLNREGYFFVALWTDFLTGPEPGILDWFTVLMGLSSVAILALHGANYLAIKTEGDLYARAVATATLMGWVALGSAVLVRLGITLVQPNLLLNYTTNSVGNILPVGGAIVLVVMLVLRRRHQDVAAFMTSSLLILALLGSVAWGCYPNILVATTDPAYSLTIFNASTSAYGLQVGVVWFVIGFVLIIVYQVYAHWAFWGKVPITEQRADGR
ncbi:MAG TPA: cytochrome d ubiquinol oxidase subunit II [Nitrospiraceae bacterium]|nr:cytochrome d ubiquinol oxidase subunit II [Nitrospiraceae bacterium]